MTEIESDKKVLSFHRLLYSSTIHPVFQLTTSRGGRLRLPLALSRLVSFQLTTSRGGRQQFHTTLRHLKLSFLCLFYIFEHFLLY